MKKYKVEVPYIVYVTAIVEAENKDDAIDAAFDDEGVGLTGYCGNGGFGKLVGVYGSNLSVEAWDEYYENESDDIGIKVFEVDE